MRCVPDKLTTPSLPPLLVYPQCFLAVKSRFAGEGKEWGPLTNNK